MSDVTLRVLLRDAASNGLRAIGRAGAAMGRAIVGGVSLAGRGISGLFRGLTSLQGLLLGGGIVYAITGLVKASWQQVRADTALAVAIARTGASVLKNLPILKQYASELQRQTVIGDEVSQSLMALGLNMDVPIDKIGEATKAAIGFSKSLGIDVNTSMRMVAQAIGGNAAMLGRYIPAIRAAETAQEKMSIALRAGNEMFKAATQEANTSEGAFTQLKNSIGDFRERLGRAIDRVFGLKERFQALRDTVDSWSGAAFEQWLERIKEGARQATALVRAIFEGGKRRGQALEAMKLMVVGMFEEAIVNAVSFLAKAAPVIGEAIGESAKKAFGGPFARGGEMNAAVRQLRQEGKLGGEGRAAGYSRAEQRQMIRDRAIEIAEMNRQMAAENAAADATKAMGSGAGGSKFERGLAKSRELAGPSNEKTDLDRLRERHKIIADEQAHAQRKAAEDAAAAQAQAMREQTEAQARISAAREKYEEANLSPEQQVAVLSRRMQALATANYANPGDRAAAAEKYFEMAAQRRDLVSGVRDRRAKEEEDRRKAVLDAQQGLQDVRRPQQSEIGIREYFRAMQNMTRGRAPDEQVAENTRRANELLQIIADNSGAVK